MSAGLTTLFYLLPMLVGPLFSKWGLGIGICWSTFILLMAYAIHDNPGYLKKIPRYLVAWFVGTYVQNRLFGVPLYFGLLLSADKRLLFSLWRLTEKCVNRMGLLKFRMLSGMDARQGIECNYLLAWVFGALRGLQAAQSAHDPMPNFRRFISRTQKCNPDCHPSLMWAYFFAETGKWNPNRIPKNWYRLSHYYASQPMRSDALLKTTLQELLTLCELYAPINRAQSLLLLQLMDPYYSLLSPRAQHLFQLLHRMQEQSNASHPQTRTSPAPLPLMVQKVFDLPPDAPDALVKKTYQRLMIKFHPDKLAGLQDPQRAREASEKAQLIQRAYQIWQQWKTGKHPSR